jgi:hypothetical protein
MRENVLRLTAAGGLAAVLLTSLAFMAAGALGAPKPSAAQYQYKVLVCHRTHSKKKPWHTISVSSSAVQAHLNHGDTLAPPCPPTETVTAASSGTSTKEHGQGKGKNKGESGTTGTSGTTSTADTSDDGGSGGHGNGNAKGKDK